MALREIKIENITRENQLNRNITIAPMHQSYALSIEYMKHWFLNKFSDDFFSFIHLDGSHVFGEITKLSKETIMSHQSNDKATLTIVPTIDDDYNRDRLDMNLFGIDQFINTTKIDKAFIQDKVNNKYLMMKMDMLLMNFTFKVNVPSRAMQLDIFKYMKLAYRVGLSESVDVDLDYIIPYPLILIMASDLGFEIKNDRVVEPIKFLTYLNSVSYIPITYKRNNANAREEYFVRVDHVPVRLYINGLTKDDGNRQGHLADSFSIEMTVETRFPSMQLYVYFSRDELTKITIGKEAYNLDNTIMMSLHYYDDPPAVNENGWSLYINTQWQEDEIGDINIELNELFKGELTQLIDQSLKMYISPSSFIDIQLYNSGKKLKSVIDWSNMKIHCDYQGQEKLVSTMAIYLDLNHVNTVRLESYSNNAKLNPSKPDRVY